eukprot:jgi/Mesvir1/19217/Mv11526-RA.1
MAASSEINPLVAEFPASEVSDYYSRYCTEDFRVKFITKTVGKGVVASKAFREGDVILKERFLVGAQHTANKAEALVCSHCMCYVGSIELQIARRILHEDFVYGQGASGGDCEDFDEGEDQDGEDEPMQDSKDAAPVGSKEQAIMMAHCLLDGSLKLPQSHLFPLPSVQPCPGGCTDEVYCSEKCATAAWQLHHLLLCSGKHASDESHPLVRFKRHADATNDIFHVAAQVVASTILRCRAARTGQPMPEFPRHCDLPVLPAGPGADARMQEDNGRETPALPAGASSGKGKGKAAMNGQGGEGSLVADKELLDAWLPFAVGHKRIWWEAVAVPAELQNNKSGAASFRQQLLGMASESLELLREAIYDPTCDALFTLDVYASIVGMFELNNLDVVVESPVESYFLHIDELPENEKEQAQVVTQPFLDALGRSYAVHCEGTGFYPLQSCMNHSCDPNAMAFKRDEDKDGSAVILAKRVVAAGEEITISYIDESDTLKERQASLADYGFVCRCPRCMAESC